MTNIDIHAVALHSVLNFIDNGLPGSLDSKDTFNFHNMISFCVSEVNAWRVHHLLQTCAFNEHYVLIFILVLL